ncbi:fimbria/pilus outer membrane usher protein, partial [Salmonella enterica]|nr:fimbria/pilus outer membrane usher protein [Salmonella enterica]
TETTMSFNVSIPLDWGENRTSVAMNYNQSSQSRSSTVSMTGSSGENSDLSWSVYGGYERYRNSNSDSSAPTTFGGNLQQNTRFGALRANYDQGDNYRQEGLGASGTLVLHPGGLTAGPYTSDTFALIHADGAQGAIVQNGQGAVVDRFGYAILPSLSPYRVNNVTLDTRKMRSDAELTGGSQQIVPYAGAIARVNFATISGKAVLISVKMPDGGIPPMGADVFNGEGTNIGMVGQSGQIYARIAHPSGSLLVRWGTGANQRCRVAYQLDLHTKEPFLYLNKICEKE